MKIFSYLRVSTKSQKESGSIETQKLAIDTYMKNHPDLELAYEFRDDGISGQSATRPAFLEMVERLGEVDGIICYDISRLSRDIKIWAYLMIALRENKKILIKVKDGTISNYAEDDTKVLTDFVEGWTAEKEVKTTTIKIKDGIKRYKLINGRWGRKPPVINWKAFDEYRTKYKPPMPFSLICQMDDISDRGKVSRSYLYKMIKGRKAL
jgi:DNA invertase Pin-like site-specific DNA recombinase